MEALREGMTHLRHEICSLVCFPEGMQQIDVPVAINRTPNLMNKTRTGMVLCSAILNQLQSNLRITFNDNLTKTLVPKYYSSLPPVSKAYGVACLMTSAAYYLQLYDPWNIALDYASVFKRLQVWRLITNFFFLGPFSFPFAIRLIMIAKYGVSLERGPFDKRTADYLWMLIFGALSLLVIGAIPFCWNPFMGVSVVYMIIYVWGREFPNARITIYGVVYLKGFYLPWAVLGLDLIFGHALKPGLVGMVAGHLYYFLTVLHPLSGGKFILKTPLWVYPFLFITLPSPQYV
ncbi:derlin-1.1 isoform X1 [Senna tora]|uniref:Derlin n=1 Tax=Senna tora TaxID=362788 RepID=A0A834X2H5_9FABA|nr:derlin-1.1 isoform X1 [Senna tora]